MTRGLSKMLILIRQLRGSKDITIHSYLFSQWGTSL